MEPQEKVESRDSPEEKSPRLDDLGGSVSLTTTETENSLENEEVTDSNTAIDTVQSATPASKPVDDLQHDPLGQEVVEPSKVSQSCSADKDEKCGTTLDSGQLPGADIYHVKWIGWGPGDPSVQNAAPKTGIVTQNINGPCPLLSIVNILLLRGKLKLPDGCEVVSAAQLLEILGEFILESVPEQMPSGEDGRRLDYEQNVNDAIAILPKLQTGLDVNVRFTGVSDFEYTPECIIFDLLNIPLYHGWLMDPQQHDVVGAVKGLTYNQLVEQIISQKNSEDSFQVSQSMIAQQFLEESASQLTYHGLCELITSIKEGELAVFFRNNHFSAIYKEKKELFLLVTDQGFLKEPKVVWETLSSIDGDGHFVDEKFVTVTAGAASGGGADANPLICDINPASSAVTSEQQIDIDHQLAQRLAEEDEKRYQRETAFEDFKANASKGEQLTDEELANRLHQEELESLAAEQQQQQQQQSRDSNLMSQAGGNGGGGGGGGDIHRQHPPSQPVAPPTSTALARQPSQRSKNCVIL